MKLKTVVAWLVVAFMVFYVITQPQDAASMMRTAGSALGTAATNVVTFMKAL